MARTVQHPAFAALLAAASSHGLEPGNPAQRFPKDLAEHDRAWIDRNPEAPFWFRISGDGTHLYPVGPFDPFKAQTWTVKGVSRLDRDGSIAALAVDEIFGGTAFWYAWDGKRLLPMANAGAVAEWCERTAEARKEAA